MSVEEVKLDETNSELVECWHCGGEGHHHDCFDGCCLDADVGCDDCTYACGICGGKGAYRVPFSSPKGTAGAMAHEVQTLAQSIRALLPKDAVSEGERK